MTTRSTQLLALYSDYLLGSFGKMSATGRSRLIMHLSHDQITQFLGDKEFDNKDLWRIVKSPLRLIQDEGAALIFDDTIEEKDDTDKSEVTCPCWDHTVGRPVKDISLLSAPLDNGLNHFAQNPILPNCLDECLCQCSGYHSGYTRFSYHTITA